MWWPAVTRGLWVDISATGSQIKQSGIFLLLWCKMFVWGCKMLVCGSERLSPFCTKWKGGVGGGWVWRGLAADPSLQRSHREDEMFTVRMWLWFLSSFHSQLSDGVLLGWHLLHHDAGKEGASRKWATCCPTCQPTTVTSPPLWAVTITTGEPSPRSCNYAIIGSNATILLVTRSSPAVLAKCVNYKVYIRNNIPIITGKISLRF